METMRSEDFDQLGWLLRAAQGGDAQAWNALLTRLRPYLQLLVRRRLAAGADGNAVGESTLVQETMLRMAQHFGDQAPEESRFRGGTPPEFLGWVGKIVAGVVANALRDAHAQRRDPRREVRGADVWEQVSASQPPEARASAAELAVRVAGELEALPEGRREVIRMRYFDQLSFDERLGKSAGLVRLTHMRALADLRDRLGDGT
jgi:RNA polymerase sigma factor (sigma-70 family)